MSKERFVKVNDDKALDTYNDVVMDLEDCVTMLNVAEHIITGSLLSVIIDKIMNE